MQDYIKEIFESTVGPSEDDIKSLVDDGKYFLETSNDQTILPSQWETMVMPGMTVLLKFGPGWIPQAPPESAWNTAIPSEESLNRYSMPENPDTQSDDEYQPKLPVLRSTRPSYPQPPPTPSDSAKNSHKGVWKRY